MSRAIRVLLLEDDAADAELIQAELARSGYKLVGMRVEDRSAFRKALSEFEPDLVLTDHSFGQFRTSEALELVQTTRPFIPTIVVTGANDVSTAVDSIHAGADDVVVKGNLDRLGPAVAHALELRAQLRELTPRQLEVLRLVTEGLSTREVAEVLGISVKTVETHRTALMKRLDVHAVVALVRYAIRVKLVRP